MRPAPPGSPGSDSFLRHPLPRRPLDRDDGPRGRGRRDYPSRKLWFLLLSVPSSSLVPSLLLERKLPMLRTCSPCLDSMVLGQARSEQILASRSESSFLHAICLREPAPKSAEPHPRDCATRKRRPRTKKEIGGSWDSFEIPTKGYQRSPSFSLFTFSPRRGGDTGPRGRDPPPRGS